MYKRQGPGGRHGRGLPGGGQPKDSRRTVVRLLRYLEEDKAKMALAFVCVIANTVCMLAGSYMLRPIINTYIAPVNGSRGDIQGLARALIALGFVFLAGVAANYYQAKVMLTVADVYKRQGVKEHRPIRRGAGGGCGLEVLRTSTAARAV